MRKRLGMKKLMLVGALLLAAAQAASAAPIKVAIVGLEHGHVGGFFSKSALTPAGGILSRPDVQLVAVVDTDKVLFDRYAARYHLPQSMRFDTIAEMVAKTHPQAALVFTAPDKHRTIVEQCAKLGVNVMMEKPLAITYADALAMQKASETGHIHVLVDYETSWYSSNTEAYNLVKSGALGPVVKTVIRDGHQGPKEIGVQPEFLSWLTDPKQGGDGALIDFGCYGPDLMTWLMDGQVPTSVFAVTKRIKPDIYPRVDDEADIVLNYPNAVAIIQGSWNWPFALKQMDVYGKTGYAKAMDPTAIEVRKKGEEAGVVGTGTPLVAPYDDPLHYLEAVLSGAVDEGNSVSGLKTNVTVSEILDAARRSSLSGKAVSLPLPK